MQSKTKATVSGNCSCPISQMRMYLFAQSNRCHTSCTCGGDTCSVESHVFDKDETQLLQETERTREVSDEDKEYLKDALLEVQVLLGLRTGMTLFDPTGVITGGFSSGNYPVVLLYACGAS